jgi:NAD(P)-dependent dehydrogenase (short-subunit alcohol dehydrogenase family)
MAGMVDGRVVAITGAGRGVGRAHALMLAREGAKVVVNDIGVRRDGAPESIDAAQQVVEEIHHAGGDAVAHTEDVSTMAGASSLVGAALDTWGTIDVVVNNAGILRDRMLVTMAEQDWDDVIRVHLKGTFAVTQAAAQVWRERSKAGDTLDARVINTTSASGIYGNVGQSNYGAAKAGIAAFTIITARELHRYGVTVNAISPTALTRMTEDIPLGSSSDAQEGQLDPEWVAPVCVWLASSQSKDVTGRIIAVSGRFLAVAEGWVRGPSAPTPAEPQEVDAIIRPLLAKARANSTMAGDTVLDGEI